MSWCSSQLSTLNVDIIVLLLLEHHHRTVVVAAAVAIVVVVQGSTDLWGQNGLIVLIAVALRTKATEYCI